MLIMLIIIVIELLFFDGDTFISVILVINYYAVTPSSS